MEAPQEVSVEAPSNTLKPAEPSSPIKEQLQEPVIENPVLSTPISINDSNLIQKKDAWTQETPESISSSDSVVIIEAPLSSEHMNSNEDRVETFVCQRTSNEDGQCKQKPMTVPPSVRFRSKEHSSSDSAICELVGELRKPYIRRKVPEASKKVDTSKRHRDRKVDCGVRRSKRREDIPSSGNNRNLPQQNQNHAPVMNNHGELST